MQQTTTGVSSWAATQRVLEKGWWGTEDEARHHPLLAACDPPERAVTPTATTSLLVCRGCRTTDPAKFAICRNSFLVCECGVQNGLADMGSDYKETHDTERSSARADRPRHEQDMALWSAKRRLEAGGTECGKRRHSAGVDGSVAALCERAADSSLDALGKKERSKLASVVAAIEDLCVKVAPVPEAVVREVRLVTKRVFLESAKHAQVCRAACCEFALYTRYARVIAAKSFVYTLDKLCAGEGVSGVSKQTLAAIHQRAHSSPHFNTQNNPSNHEFSLAMIATIDTHPERLATACVRPAEPARSEPPAKLTRQTSDVLESKTSQLVALRDAIGKINNEFGFGAGAFTAAISSLQNNEFAGAIKTHTLLPSRLSKYAIAYLILRGVAQQHRLLGTRVFDDQADARRVGLGGHDVAELLAMVQRKLPARSADARRADDDDDFY